MRSLMLARPSMTDGCSGLSGAGAGAGAEWAVRGVEEADRSGGGQVSERVVTVSPPSLAHAHIHVIRSLSGGSRGQTVGRGAWSQRSAGRSAVALASSHRHQRTPFARPQLCIYWSLDADTSSSE